MSILMSILRSILGLILRFIEFRVDIEVDFDIKIVITPLSGVVISFFEGVELGVDPLRYISLLPLKLFLMSRIVSNSASDTPSSFIACDVAFWASVMAAGVI